MCIFNNVNQLVILTITCLSIFICRSHAYVLDKEPTGAGEVTVMGELKQWHEVKVLMNGPFCSESDSIINPYLDYKMTVVFSKGKLKFTVPGHFAADGNAGSSGAVAGDQWRAYFSPPETGVWHYEILFVTGKNCAVSSSGGQKVELYNGRSGSFTIFKSDKEGRDFRSTEKGLIYMPNNPSNPDFKKDNHYLTFKGSGKPWLKGGANIPENLFGYDGFDNTPDPGHSFTEHEKDWKTGDPDWGNGKGKRLIGVFNYLADVGVNSVYFLPMNIGGDGDDTFPTIAPQDKTHFDVSKLDQWNIVFGHASNKGINLHVVLAETEEANENYHDNGTLGIERKLYYRELISRFSHHLAIEWDLGEENNYTSEEHKAFAAELKSVDPYDHPVTTHIIGGKWNEYYEPLLGNTDFDKTTFQGGPSRMKMAELMMDWRNRSASAGVPWMISFDEPQRIENDITDMELGYPHGRRNKMWPLYMSGGGGFEWYVQEDGRGHTFDQRINDFREMSACLKWTGYALGFFEQLPISEMKPDHLLASTTEKECNNYVLAKPGEAYVVFNDRQGTGINLDLTATRKRTVFEILWFDPRGKQQGLLVGSKKKDRGGKVISLGNPPYETDQDWAVVVRKKIN